MNYTKMLELLKSNDVYNELKNNENDIFRLIPELEKCKGFNQNNNWHIYDVYEHILHVILNTKTDICLRLAALFHDIGKPLVYTEDSNKIGHFYNHWNESLKIFCKYQDKFNLTNMQCNLIKNLIYYHDINISKMTDKEIKEMIKKIGDNNIYLLFELKKADLLAQSDKYHYLIEDIELQYENIKKLSF